MRVTAYEAKIRVQTDPSMNRPVVVVLFGHPGVRLALSTAEAVDLADRLVDAVEDVPTDA